MTANTIAAIATRHGGAISIIRVSGPQAIALVDRLYIPSNGKPLAQTPSHSIVHGKIIALRADQTEEFVDEVLVSVFLAPHTYTGEDVVEINCHGSRFIAKRIMELLIDAGASQAAPGEFTQRAFVNGKMDLSQAEAIADLVSANSAATHQMAISQLRGGFRQEFNALRDELLQLTTLLELELDFSEEDVEFANRSQLHALASKVEARIQSLRDSFQTGNAIKNGIAVAIIGAPNVGKSTLLNALLHEDRAIVSNIQGTTRDVIEDSIQIQGLTFRFADTAGIRHTHDTIERMGIARSIQAMEKAKIVILLSDNANTFPDIDIPADKEVLRVLTKCDMHHPASSYIFNRVQPGGFIHISGLTGAGIPLLERELVRAADIPQVNENSPIVTNLRHYQAFTRAHANISRALSGMANGLPTDLIAQDLRHCTTALSEITGASITSDEVLTSIFSNFCIGK